MSCLFMLWPQRSGLAGVSCDLSSPSDTSSLWSCFPEWRLLVFSLGSLVSGDSASFPCQNAPVCLRLAVLLPHDAGPWRPPPHPLWLRPLVEPGRQPCGPEAPRPVQRLRPQAQARLESSAFSRRDRPEHGWLFSLACPPRIPGGPPGFPVSLCLQLSQRRLPLALFPVYLAFLITEFLLFFFLIYFQGPGTIA